MEQLIWVVYLCAAISAGGKCTADLVTPMPLGESQCLAHATATTPPATGFVTCQTRKIEAAEKPAPKPSPEGEAAPEQPK